MSMFLPRMALIEGKVLPTINTLWCLTIIASTIMDDKIVERGCWIISLTRALDRYFIAGTCHERVSRCSTHSRDDFFSDEITPSIVYIAGTVETSFTKLVRDYIADILGFEKANPVLHRIFSQERFLPKW